MSGISMNEYLTAVGVLEHMIHNIEARRIEIEQ
jgi:hypothetical protein